MKIAVTGTIGSGKSTLCRELQKRLPEFTIVSVDEVVNSIYTDTDFLEVLQEQFGVSSKKEASDLVFANPHLRHELEQLSLGYIAPRLYAALDQNKIIVEFPLLFEMSAFASKADLVVAVGCDDATQEARVVARDKMPLQKLQAVRASQYSRELRAALADVYIDTGLSRDEQEADLTALVVKVRTLALRHRALAVFGSKVGEEIWNLIAARYNEPHRNYHTLWHLHELFEALRPHQDGHHYAPAMELATWFHDIVYDIDPTLYATNEARSAKEMLRILAQYRPDWLSIDSPMHEQVYLAAEIIVATKKHKMTAAWVLAKSDIGGLLHAANLFMDADMSILAAQTHRFCEYDDQITREWGQEPYEESRAFCEGRLGALRSFKAAGPVFITDEFKHLEVAAQFNLDDAIRLWEQKLNALPV